MNKCKRVVCINNKEVNFKIDFYRAFGAGNDEDMKDYFLELLNDTDTLNNVFLKNNKSPNPMLSAISYNLHILRSDKYDFLINFRLYNNSKSGLLLVFGFDKTRKPVKDGLYSKEDLNLTLSEFEQVYYDCNGTTIDNSIKNDDERQIKHNITNTLFSNKIIVIKDNLTIGYLLYFVSDTKDIPDNGKGIINNFRDKSIPVVKDVRIQVLYTHIQRVGIGTNMVDSLIYKLQSLYDNKMYITVNTSIDYNYTFYEKYGFELIEKFGDNNEFMTYGITLNE